VHEWQVCVIAALVLLGAEMPDHLPAPSCDPDNGGVTLPDGFSALCSSV